MRARPRFGERILTFFRMAGTSSSLSKRSFGVILGPAQRNEESHLAETRSEQRLFGPAEIVGQNHAGHLSTNCPEITLLRISVVVKPAIKRPAL